MKKRRSIEARRKKKNVFCEISLFCCLSDHNDLYAHTYSIEDLLLSTAKIVNYNHKSMQSPFNSAHTYSVSDILEYKEKYRSIVSH
jgi:hypothetical protein